MVRFCLVDNVLRTGSRDMETCGAWTVKDLLSSLGVPKDGVYIIHNGVIAPEELPLTDGGIYRAVPRLVGGKGGFGSMLRTIGAQIEKTTNREACRDLSGRRMRDINNEKKLQDWVAKKADREREVEEQRRQRRERRQQLPKHVFDDPKYVQQKSTVIENLDDAVQQGLKRTVLAGCREEPAIAAKKPKASAAAATAASSSSAAGSSKGTATEWLGDFDECSSSDADSSSSEPCSSHQLPLGSTVPHTSTVDDGSSSSNGSSGSSSDRMPASMKSDASAAAAAANFSCGDSADKPGGLPAADSGGSNSGGLKPCITDGGLTEVDVVRKEANATVVQDCPSLKSEDAVTKSRGSTDEERGCSTGVDGNMRTPANDGVTDVSHDCVTDVSHDCVTDGPGAARAAKSTFGDVEEVLATSDSPEQLEKCGLDDLKSALMSRGMKCGGTLQERARRLFSVKGLTPSEIDPKLRAAPAATTQRKLSKK